eukprot:SAG31_NODE_9312_length_1300_cov_1.116570_3_plen_156_part_00
MNCINVSKVRELSGCIFEPRGTNGPEFGQEVPQRAREGPGIQYHSPKVATVGAVDFAERCLGVRYAKHALPVSGESYTVWKHQQTVGELDKPHRHRVLGRFVGGGASVPGELPELENWRAGVGVVAPDRVADSPLGARGGQLRPPQAWPCGLDQD